MFSNISTKAKLLVLPLVFIAIAIISGSVYSYYNNIVKSKSTNAKITSNMVEQLLLGRIFVYQFLNEPSSNRAQKVIKRFNSIEKQANEILKYTTLKEDINFVNDIKKLVNNYIKMFEIVATNKEKAFKSGITQESEKTMQVISKMAQIGIKLQKELEEINENANLEMSKAQSSQTTMLLAIGVIASILFIVIALTLIKNILGNLTNFQKGLTSFFSYLNNETTNIELLDDKNQDEFGQMASVVNQNIEKTRNNIDQDRKIIDEAVRILTEYEKGDFSSKINLSSSNKALNDLTKMINDMSANLEKNIDLILKVLNDYSNSNYTNKVSTDGIKAHLAQLATGVNTLGDSISELLRQSLEIGLTLDNSSDILIGNVNNLNDSANSAAASLEETAAALEEITSTIVSNGQNIQQMNQYTDDLNSSAKQGQKLAQKTTTAMEDIDEQVSSINEAITVIDQIAFQTNILSLNAAVEAATAGEAGKGFAVVAAEVRNLASRSAEAAKEIKDLVENATAKANEGKNISTEMIKGYNSLLENISNSTEKINEISTASKEQETGITQINDAINSLDKQTQENAATANKTQDIALDTDRVAKEIVADARSKEFIGKDSISVQKKQTQVQTEIKTTAVTPKEIEKKQNYVAQKSSDEEWESF